MKTINNYLYKSTVQFDDLDAAGVVHHPKYLNFLERARLSFLEEVGLGYTKMLQQGVAIPVVEVKMKYLSPLLMADEIFITSGVKNVANKVIVLEQKVFKSNPQNSNSVKPCFEAELTLISVDMKTMKSCALPEELLLFLTQ